METQSPLLPIFLKLAKQPCLVVGAGAVGLQKVSALLECDAAITVVAPEAREEIRTLAAGGQVRWIERGYRSNDLEGTRLVIAATNDVELNHRVHREANASGVLVNAVDDPPFCDFYFSSVVRRGALQIAISTAGESPALAQRLREEVSAALPKDVGGWLARLGSLRREVLGTWPPGATRNRLLRRLAGREVCESDACPSRQMARKERVLVDSWWLT